MTVPSDAPDTALLSVSEVTLPNRPLSAFELDYLYARDGVEDIRVEPTWESVDPHMTGAFDAFGIVHAGWTGAWVREPDGWKRLAAFRGRRPVRLTAIVAEYEASRQDRTPSPRRTGRDSDD
ncbi:hypothetical protein [Haladaptatus sp. DFWS20]|uniref:hypothetical protein n=1 Tax=Haladaptatus sp. DFWS20 TaxID=3403467 RepID=UPI003EBDD4FE